MEPALKSYICFFALCIPYVPTLPFSLSWMWNVNFRHREAGEKKNRAMILVVHHARIPWPINVPLTSTNFLSFWLVFNFVYINCSLDPPLPCEVLSLHPLFVQARVEDPFGDKTRFSGDRILAKAPAIATSTTRLKLWKEVASLHPK